MMSNEELVWTGRIVLLEAIPDADFIEAATVVCGRGGKWRGVVKKGKYAVGAPCVVYLPDSLLPEADEYRFMEKQKWRVRMCRFRGVASEVLIMPEDAHTTSMPVGIDVTQHYNVVKYCKPVPQHLQGVAKGNFPDFIPKTDELNYQRHSDLVEALAGKAYYVTQKMDGSSCTVYRWKGEFGVCSRNLELVRNEDNGYWRVAAKYELEERLPEGYAVQFEVCGPGVQGNPAGLKELDGFAFSVYMIAEKRYATFDELLDLTEAWGMQMCRIVEHGQSFDVSCIPKIGEGVYDNGKPHEGVVIRSQDNFFRDHPISFKVINLDYGN